MKILFTSKKQIILNIITILLISIFLFFTFSVPHSFAIELVENSVMSDELMSKISNITKNKEKPSTMDLQLVLLQRFWIS